MQTPLKITNITIRLSKAVVLSMAGTLFACSNLNTVSSNKFPDMKAIYDSVTGRGVTAIHETENTVRPPSYNQPTTENDVAPYTRTVENETDFQFRRLPNPTIFLYLDPHLVGDEGIPVPGYTTAFTLYERDHWALPYEAPTPISVIRGTRSE